MRALEAPCSGVCERANFRFISMVSLESTGRKPLPCSALRLGEAAFHVMTPPLLASAGGELALTFDSIAVFDPASQGIKFAGRHVDPKGIERFVICLVSGDALRARFKLEDPSPDQLLAAYKEIKEDVHRVAARHFAAGERRPSISVQDLL